MRSIDEIKADIKNREAEIKSVEGRNDEYGIDTRIYQSGMMKRLNDELRAAITADIQIERLEAICSAERDNRCVVLPSRNDEIVHSIELALGIKLYDWQKAYIFGASDYMMRGRRTGRTTAYVLKLLLSEGEPLRLYNHSELEKVCDEYHGSQYYEWFKRFVMEMYYQLSNPELRLNLRTVYFTRESFVAARKERNDVNRSKNEAPDFAEYFGEHPPEE